MSADAERPGRNDLLNVGQTPEVSDPQLADIGRIYKSEAPKLQRYFRARLRSGDEAGDLVQEAFARLLRVMGSEAPYRPAAYLQRIARNLLFNRTKRLENRLSPLHVSFDDGYEHAMAPDQSDRIEVEDVMRIYRHALAQLSERTRQVFLLHRVDELTYREIGERLGISVPTVQYHVARALAHIDAALEQE